MNPSRWHRSRQIALGISASVGGAAGVIVGYFLYHMQEGDGAEEFGDWVLTPFQTQMMDTAFYNLASVEWFAFGGLMGAALFYAIMLAKKSN